MGEDSRSRTSVRVRSLVTACVLVAGLLLAISAFAATHAKLVKDINPGASSEPDELANVSGTLFFSAYDPDHGVELWKSDGTKDGTKLVKDIRPGGGLDGGSAPLEITSFRGLALFRAAEDGFGGGYELWKSDGTKRGTRLVKDLDPDRDGSFPTDRNPPFRGVGRTLFFASSDRRHGAELWQSRGGRRSTKLVDDINPGRRDSDPAQLASVAEKLFFVASDGRDRHGRELWKAVP